jgi:hypothetical protein
VTQEAFNKLGDLLKAVRPLGHPRAKQEDIVGALIDAATPKATAKALNGYNPKLGQALDDLEKPSEGDEDADSGDG